MTKKQTEKNRAFICVSVKKYTNNIEKMNHMLKKMVEKASFRWNDCECIWKWMTILKKHNADYCW